jgi:hypothetical protein
MDLISAIFAANLSFIAILLAVIGIVIPIYANVGLELKAKFKKLLKIFGINFFLSVFVTILCLIYLVNASYNILPICLQFNPEIFIVTFFIGEILLLVVGVTAFISYIT